MVNVVVASCRTHRHLRAIKRLVLSFGRADDASVGSIGRQCRPREGWCPSSAGSTISSQLPRASGKRSNVLAQMAAHLLLSVFCRCSAGSVVVHFCMNTLPTGHCSVAHLASASRDCNPIDQARSARRQPDRRFIPRTRPGSYPTAAGPPSIDPLTNRAAIQQLPQSCDGPANSSRQQRPDWTQRLQLARPHISVQLTVLVVPIAPIKRP